MSVPNTIGIMRHCADADYPDPLAKVARPFRVVHRWKQGGREREHARLVGALPTRYEIVDDDDPEMVSVTCEMPATR